MSSFNITETKLTVLMCQLVGNLVRETPSLLPGYLDQTCIPELPQC